MSMDGISPNRNLKIPMGERKFSLRGSPSRATGFCEICGEQTELYCTMAICQKCCEKGLCPYKDFCRRYPTIIENILKRRRFDPSRRDVGEISIE